MISNQTRIKEPRIHSNTRFEFIRDRNSSSIRDRKAGFTLVEMLFYIAILVSSLLAVTEVLIITTRSFGTLRAAIRLEQETSFAMERMIREIRDARSVDLSGSVLGTDPGELLLNTTTASGTPKTVEFYIESGRLMLKENGVVSGALTSSKTALGSLIFRRIDSGRSEGVKIEMAMQSGIGVAARSEHFYATAVLRDSY